MDPIILLQNLNVSYDKEAVLCNLNLTVAVGEAIAVVGPSGAGKTTLLKTLLGLLPQDCGLSYEKASLCGNPWPTTEQGWHNLRGRRITYVTQEAMSSFSPFFTIEAQCRDLAKAIGLNRTDALRRIESLCIALDLAPNVLSLYPAELSGGMAQRVALLLALLPKPDILVADEPAANLDMLRQLQMADLLKKVQAMEGLTLLFVTHQRELAHCISHTVYELRDGALQPIVADVNIPSHNLEDLAVSSKALSTTPILEVQNLWAAYEGNAEPVLQDVSLTVKVGEWVALVGLSGAGKSTLFRCLLGWQSFSEGAILYKQGPLKKYSPGTLGRLVQPIWQDPQSSFNPRQTVGWSIAESMKCAKHQGYVKLKKSVNSQPKEPAKEPQVIPADKVKFLSQECTILSQEDRAELMGIGQAAAPVKERTGPAEKEETGRSIEDQVAELLRAVNLPSAYSKRYPHMMSGGECQRAALARALGNDPDLLLCDEMTSALDSKTQREILDLLKHLKYKQQLAGLVITHDLAVAEALCDRIYILDEGSIVETGAVNEVLTRPQSDLGKQLVAAADNLKVGVTKI